MTEVHNQSGRAVVVAPQFEVHPNANALMLAKVGGYTVVVRKDEWAQGDLGIYIPPDSVVALEREEFKFLAAMPNSHPERIRIRRFRGVVSEGLLLRAPTGAVVGQDFTDQLGITRYEAPITNSGIYFASEEDEAPAISVPRFDVEALKKFPNVFRPGEEVVVTEKIHGANGRYVYWDDRLRVGSRNRWVKDGDNIWWSAARRNLWLEHWCKENPGYVLCGEVFGWVQDLRYGRDQGEVDFIVFDIFDTTSRTWWSPAAVSNEFGRFSAPWVFNGPFDDARIIELADGPSLVGSADHIREGIVIRPMTERTDPVLETLGGRVMLKVVSNKYLERQ